MRPNMRWLVSYLGVWHRAQFGTYRPEGCRLEMTCSPPVYALEVVEGDLEAWFEGLQQQLQRFRFAPSAGQIAVEVIELFAVTPLGAEGRNPFHVLLH